MICSITCADPMAVETIALCSTFNSVSASTSSIPVTPIIGVRISWLIVARNLVLAIVASLSVCDWCSAVSRSMTTALATSAPADERHQQIHDRQLDREDQF